MLPTDYAAPSDGVYAVSAHKLAWIRKVDAYVPGHLDWLTRFVPVARIGYSIYVYRFPQRQ